MALHWSRQCFFKYYCRMVILVAPQIRTNFIRNPINCCDLFFLTSFSAIYPSDLIDIGFTIGEGLLHIFQNVELMKNPEGSPSMYHFCTMEKHFFISEINVLHIRGPLKLSLSS